MDIKDLREGQLVNRATTGKTYVVRGDYWHQPIVVNGKVSVVGTRNDAPYGRMMMIPVAELK